MKEMIKRIREERGGFTLAELLVVVAIIAVLVAIAVPVFQGAQTSAQTAVVEANQRSVKSEAASMYLLAKDQDAVNKLPAYFSIDKNGKVTTSATELTPTSDLQVYKVTYPAKPAADGTTVENVDVKVDQIKATS